MNLLKEHLHKSRLTSNAALLLVWLLLSAHHSGLKRGCIEANIEDLMLGLGWSRSMVRRSLAELVSKGYVSFSGAANKQGLGMIRILKSDLVEPAQSTGEPSKSVEPAARPTSEPSKGRLDSTQLTSEPGVPIELRAALISEPSKGFEIPPKCLFTGELSTIACQTLAYIGFQCDRRHLSIGFVSVLDWLGKRQHLPLPGLLASRIIDRCLFQQRKRKAGSRSPNLYFWPPGFQKWRDSLRRAEREQGRLERARAVA